MDTQPDSGLLGGYIVGRARLAAELGITVRTLARWQHYGLAPPSALFGGKRIWRIEAVKQWLMEQEQKTSSGGPRRRRRR